ncbi:MAG TPA: hypothetical protein VF510_01895 [Ktedonobacterales bacterium]
MIYLDASGGLFLDVTATSLGAPKPDESADHTTLIERLVKRVDRATTILCTLLRERGYGGRLHVRVSANTGMGYDLKTRVHIGSTIISVADDLDTVRGALVLMLSQMTRSWLGYPFTILRWDGNGAAITSL